MQLFAQLFTRLDETTSTNRKIAALVDYFHQAPPADAIWAVHFLTGRRPKRLIPTRKLRQWAAELAGIPDWLFDASYDLVGDLAETITLVLPAEPTPSGLPLHKWIETRLLPLSAKERGCSASGCGFRLVCPEHTRSDSFGTN
jgi:DNA ligase-1